MHDSGETPEIFRPGELSISIAWPKSQGHASQWILFASHHKKIGGPVPYSNDYSQEDCSRLLKMISGLSPEDKWRHVRDEATNMAHWCSVHKVSPFTLPTPNRVWLVEQLIAMLGRGHTSA